MNKIKKETVNTVPFLFEFYFVKSIVPVSVPQKPV